MSLCFLLLVLGCLRSASPAASPLLRVPRMLSAQATLHYHPAPHCIAPALPPCRLEGAAGASGLGVFPLIDEACRLPRATYQASHAAHTLLSLRHTWMTCVPCLCGVLAAGAHLAAHLLCPLACCSACPAQDLAHTLRSRLACISLALASLKHSYLVSPFHTPALPTGPGPHAAQPAGGPAALWGAQARAACLCCGPLCGRSVLHHGAADGEEQGKLCLADGEEQGKLCLADGEEKGLVWFAPAGRLSCFAAGGLCMLHMPIQAPDEVTALLLIELSFHVLNCSRQCRTLWWRSTHTCWAAPPSPSFASCLPPMLRRQPLVAPPLTPLLRPQAVSCPVPARLMARWVTKDILGIRLQFSYGFAAAGSELPSPCKADAKVNGCELCSGQTVADCGVDSW